jgi:signal transduction histidine kinase/ligand-binding sensor domain-containing protein
MKPLLHRALRYLLSICCATTLPALTQTISNLGHQAWTTENGLPQNSVHAIFQSRDGYLWIATEGGIARFDGVEFKVFQHENTPALTRDDICCFAQTADPSTLWIGTADGVLRYSSGSFRRYGTADHLPATDVLALTSDGSTIYALTGGGLARFDGSTFSPIAVSSTPTAIAGTSDQGLLVAAATELMQYRQGSFTRSYQKLAPARQPVQAFGVLADHTLWQRSASTLTFTANGLPRTVDSSALNGARIESFLSTSNGALWIGTSKGLYHLDDSTSTPHLVPDIAANSILSLFEDAEGNLWVGTEADGLHVLRGRNFTALRDGSDRVITAITQTDDGAKWIGSSGDGLDRWLTTVTTHFSAHSGLLSDIILSLAPGASNDLWVGTPDGLNHIQGNHIDSLTSADGLPDDFIRSLLSDEDGSLWIGTRRGLAHLHDHTVTTFTRANGLRSDLVGALLQSHSNGDLWIATLDGLSLLHNGAIKTFTNADGLSGNIITALFEDPTGNLWIGTQGNGLTLRTSDGRFTALHRADFPETIHAIVGDDQGALWFAASRGITRAPLFELIACSSSPSCSLHINRYGISDGMPTEETSAIGHPSVWKTTGGPLWFATRKGVAIVDPAHLFFNRIPPPVVIERFAVDDIEQPAGVRIPPRHIRLDFQYAGLSFVAPSQVRYRYLLEGFDKQWTEAGSRRTAYYTNLPPGRYRFLVLAANNDGLWNERGAELAFSIQPPFYRRLWFFLLTAAVLAGSVFLMYRLRLRRLQSRFSAVLAERNRVAREIHDTLAQSFVGVSVQLELATHLLAHQQIDSARNQLDRTRAYVREGIAEARRSIWDLRAATAQNTLPTRLSRLTEQFSSDGLAVQLNIGGIYRPLEPTIENEILRIAQESLTNISHHAHASSANFALRYEASGLTLTITDDGRGFSLGEEKTLAAHGHFGLQGMRERASQIGADLSIVTSPGKGTRITLVLPLAPGRGATHNA